MKSYDFNLYDFCKENKNKQMYEVQGQLFKQFQSKTVKEFNAEKDFINRNGNITEKYNKDFKIRSFVGHIESTMEIDKRNRYDYEHLTNRDKVLIKASEGFDTLLTETILVLEYKTKIGYSEDKIVDETIYLTSLYDITQTIKSNIRNKSYSEDDELIIHEFDNFLEFLNYLKDKKEKSK